jgi:cytoplasmic iron level regulating protein YaaA (DUF328/UPF0246 family)
LLQLGKKGNIMSFLVLLSPSKTQELGPRYQAHTLPEFLDKAETLVRRLQKLSVKEFVTVMKMSDKLGELTADRYRSFTFPPQIEKSRQALLAFRGDVFAEIEADAYSDNEWNFCQDHLRILSGLYGLLRPLDLIQPYRLEIGGAFKPAPSTSLYSFWKEEITSAIAQTLATKEGAVLLNLASGEYFKVIDRKKISAPIIDVSFKQEKEGKLRTIAIHAKKARGALANYIIRNRVAGVEELSKFSYNGYFFSKKLSSQESITYVNQ